MHSEGELRGKTARYDHQQRIEEQFLKLAQTACNQILNLINPNFRKFLKELNTPIYSFGIWKI